MQSKTRTFLSALSMGLLYFSIYMGIIVVNVRGTQKTSVDTGVLAHYVLVLIAGALLYTLIRRRVARIRFLSVFFILLGLFCLSIPFLPQELFARFFVGKPPVIAPSIAIFTPLALFIFARALPANKEGIGFAILLALCELLWALIFPLLGLVSPHAENQQASYIFSLCSWMVGSAGICLAICAIMGAPEPEAAPTPHNADKIWQPLALIFLAGVLGYTMTGFCMGVFVPKMALQSESLGIPHFICIFLLPAVGFLLDINPRMAMLFCTPVLICIFVSAVAYDSGMIGKVTLYYFLNMQQMLLNLALYTAVAKLLRSRAVLLPVIVLTYLFVLLHFVGIGLNKLTSIIPYSHNIIVFIMLVGIVLCLLQARRMLFVTGKWYYKAPSRNELAKLSNFAVKYVLTERELDVLSCLLKGMDRKEMARELNLTVRTVRYHISNLQKKVSMPNEKSLINHYHSWE